MSAFGPLPLQTVSEEIDEQIDSLHRGLFVRASKDTAFFSLGCVVTGTAMITAHVFGFDFNLITPSITVAINIGLICGFGAARFHFGQNQVKEEARRLRRIQNSLKALSGGGGKQPECLTCMPD